MKILNTRHSFEIKPDPGFEWEYKILAIEDSNYPRIDLIESESGSRYEFKQNVPMIGGAEFKNSNERIRKVFTCQGEMVDVDVVLKVCCLTSLPSQMSNVRLTYFEYRVNHLTNWNTLSHPPLPSLRALSYSPISFRLLKLSTSQY